jgi:hypothetical protein
MAARTLIDRVGDVAREDLAALGFKKRTGQTYTIDLGEGMLGILGLNSATEHQHKGVVGVNPIIGLRHQEVERMVAELRGTPFNAYHPATVNTPLGYLMPGNRYVEWTIDTNGSTLSRQVKDMVEAVRAYGLPFMKENRTLESVRRLLDEGIGYDHQLVYRRPVAYLLAGEERLAREILDASVARLGERTDAAAQQLRQFAEALRPRLAA